MLQVVFGNIYPRRPKSALRFGLTDEVWTLMKQCWDRLPTSRPSMKTIVSELTEITNHQQVEIADEEERSSLYTAESDKG